MLSSFWYCEIIRCCTASISIDYTHAQKFSVFMTFAGNITRRLISSQECDIVGDKSFH
jgi:hypothetical protein